MKTTSGKAEDYVVFAEQPNGAIPRPVDFSYVWDDALAALDRAKPASADHQSGDKRHFQPGIREGA